MGEDKRLGGYTRELAEYGKVLVPDRDLALAVFEATWDWGDQYRFIDDGPPWVVEIAEREVTS